MRFFTYSACLLLSIIPITSFANDGSSPAFTEICTADVKEELAETCKQIRLEQAALILRRAKMENALNGNPIVTGKAGTTAFTEASGKSEAGSYSTILAVNAATRAGHSMGREICQRVPGRHIYFGKPSDYRHAALEEKRYRRLYKYEGERLSRLAKELDRITALTHAYILRKEAEQRITPPHIPGTTVPFSGPVENTNSQAGASSLGSINSTITTVASSVEAALRLLRSDVEITAFDVTIPTGTLETAVKSGILRASQNMAQCYVRSAEQTLSYSNPLETSVIDFEDRLNALRYANDALMTKVTEAALLHSEESVELEGFLKSRDELLAKTTAFIIEAEESAKELWNGLTVAPGQNGEISGPSLLDLIISAHSVRTDVNATFVDVKIVESAAATVNSSGLFRSDRMHFHGNVVTKYEIIDRNGWTIGSGLRDVGLADMVRDRIGFATREKTYEQPLIASDNRNGSGRLGRYEGRR